MKVTAELKKIRLEAERSELQVRPTSTVLGVADNAPHQGGRNRKEKLGHVGK